MAVIDGTSDNDTLKGGAGNDIITGFAGNDRALMGGGNDVFIWNPGDGKDTIAGGLGSDTLRFYGDDKSEIFAVSANGAHATVVRSVDSAVLDLNDVERIDLRARGSSDLINIWNLAGTDVTQVAIDLAGTTAGVGDGSSDGINLYGMASNDAISVAFVNNRMTVTGLAAKVTIANADATDALFVQGGTGNDTISASSVAGGHMDLRLNGAEGNDRVTGSKGNDALYGDIGNDTIAGGKGADSVYLGDGNDQFLWQAGDGSDVVEGGSGVDTLRLTGSNAGETFNVGGIGGSAYFFHNNSLKVDGTELERIEIRALGGADKIDVTDLSGSAVRQVAVDLAATAGGQLADSNADTVSIYGSFNNDFMDARWINGQLRVTGLTAKVSVAHAGKNDTVIINGGLGDDVLNAAGVSAGKVRLQLLGGAGNDHIFGSDGNDTVVGGVGDDVVFLGAGNDRFTWTWGDGFDKVEGQEGVDTLMLTGDSIKLTAVDDRVSVGLLDISDIEHIQIQSHSGGDYIDVGDLTGTGVAQVTVDLAADAGLLEFYDDVVHVRGTDGNDTIAVTTPSADAVSVTGLAAQVTVTHGSSNDTLTVLGGNGNDVISASTASPIAMELGLDGGSGNDRVTGGAGRDHLYGRDGTDTLKGNAGNDVIYGGQNDDHLDGGSGDDALLGDEGGDVILGGLGNDLIFGGAGDDTLTGGAGNDSFQYTTTLDGHDVILDFDGDATGGQDTLNLDALFDALMVANDLRAARVDIDVNSGTVDIRVNADGNGANGFELHVATLNTTDTIAIHQDILVT